MIRRVVYFGYSDFKDHKRGVENVIEFQAQALPGSCIAYYIAWGNETVVKKSNGFVAITIKKNAMSSYLTWPFLLNIFLVRLKRKKNSLFFIHSHNFLMSSLSLFKTNLLTVHDGLYYLAKSKRNFLLKQLIFRCIENIVYRRTSYAHFISNFTKEQSLWSKRTDFVIIPNTSHLEAKVSAMEYPEQQKRGKIKIFIVKSIEERARIDLIVELAEKLKHDNIEIQVAGKGPLLEHYKLLIEQKRLSNIALLGYVAEDELIKLYKQCDLVLSIAEYGEGFGLSIIEGYLFNKPVIASNKCAIPEVIIDKRYLVKNTVEDVIKKLKEWQHLEEDNFRDYYENKFSNKVILEKTKKMYKKLFT